MKTPNAKTPKTPKTPKVNHWMWKHHKALKLKTPRANEILKKCVLILKVLIIMLGKVKDRMARWIDRWTAWWTARQLDRQYTNGQTDRGQNR
jgi:hypothetical protein